MRKLILSILLASAVAAPALADPNDDRAAARQAAKAERQQANEERQQAREQQRSANTDRSPPPRQEHFSPQAQQQPQPQQQQQSNDRAARLEQRQQRQDQRATDRDVRLQQQDVAQADRAADRNAARDARQANREQTVEQRRALVEQRRNQPGRNTPPVVSNTPRPGTQPPPPAISRPTPAPTWSTSWRHNNKYDWQNWRRHHRNRFHLGFYYDPFGWGYSPFQIGWRLWPSYYGNQFWINPGYYNLPYAPPGYQWVRYYDDALLVDTWSGQVVDVIYNFFW